jgi:hypothetical protein
MLWYNCPIMLHFNSQHIFILPQAEEYRRFYDIPLEHILSTLNEPDIHEGLATGHYTAEKAFPTHQVYVYYYLTLPLQGDKDEAYAIVDFIGYTNQEDHLNVTQ